MHGFKFGLISSLMAPLLLSSALISQNTHANEQCDSDQLSKREQKLLAWCERPGASLWVFKRFREWKENFCEELFGNEPPTPLVQAVSPAQEHSYITLDAASSSDPDNDALTFSWSQISGTPAIAATELNVAAPSFYLAKGSAGEQLLFEVAVSDGEATVTQQVTVEVTTCSDITEGSIFSNCVAPAWNGVSAWEMLNNGSNENYHYQNGHNDNLVQWQILNTEEAGYNEVIDIHYADRTDVNGFARIYTAGGIGATADFSSYATGSLDFDMRVLDWGDSSGAFFLKLECIYPCESAWFTLNFNNLNEWQHFSIPASVLAQSGFDLSNLEIGFQVFPDWNLQANAHYQVDNIAWVAGDLPVDNGGDAITLEPSAWNVNNASGVSDPQYAFDEIAFTISPNWQSDDAAVAFGHYFDPTVNLDGGSIALDIFVPQSAVDTDGLFGIYAFDSNWNAVFLNPISLSSFNGDSWNTINIATFDETRWDMSNRDFNPADVIYLDFLLVANGSTNSPGEFVVKNAQILPGSGPGNPAPGGNEDEIVVSADAWTDYTVAGSPIIDWSVSDTGDIRFNSLVGVNGDNRMYINYLNEIVNLSDGTLNATLEIPENLAGKAIVLQTFLLDSQGRYATPGGTNIQSFESATSLDWSLREINDSTFSYADEGFDLSAIAGVGVQVMFFEDLSINSTQLNVYNITLIPGEGSVNPGNGNPTTVEYSFEDTNALENWYYTTPELYLYQTTTWEGNGALAISPTWITDTDQFQVFSYLQNTLNLDMGTLNLRFEMPQSYVDDGNLLVRAFIEDTSGWRAYFTPIDWASIAANNYLPMDVSYNIDIGSLEADDGFDITQVTGVGFDFNANGKPVEIQGDVLIDSIVLSESQDQSGPVDPVFGEDNPVWNVWISADPASQWYFENEELVIEPVWTGDSDSITVNYDSKSSTDITAGSASVELYLPASYLNQGLNYQLIIFDSGTGAAITNSISVDTLTGDSWNTLTIPVMNSDNFIFISSELDLSQIRGMEFFISTPSVAGLPTDTLRIKNFTLTP